MKANLAIGLLALAAALGSTPALATELSNGRITVELATSAQGWTTTDKDRVDFISWIQSDGTSTGNLAVHSGYLVCGEPGENFGQSYNEGSIYDGNLNVVIGGTVSQWRNVESRRAGIAATDGDPTCNFTSISAIAKTTYALDSRAAIANAMKIKRTFQFLPQAADVDENLHAYVPRLSLPKYTTVLLPETDGTVHTYNAHDCAVGCELSSWNGKWFADDNGQGYGMAVIRDAASTWPAVVSMDNDGGSNSNLTAVVLLVPQGGFTGTITETEWLCFYDPTTWPAAARNAGILPTGCRVKTR